MSKKYISFSLWGNSRLYCEGAIENIECAKKWYPDFVCRFYVASNCPALPILRTLDCEVVEMPPIKGIDRTSEAWVWQKDHIAMFWRYFIIDELGEGDVVLFRDCDSRVSERESKVVYRWLERGNEVALIFAENESHHNSWAMGGMWGIVGGVLTNIHDSIHSWIYRYNEMSHPWIFVDLEYNTNVIGPMIDTYTLKYGHGFSRALPELKEGERFIGDVYEPQWREEEFDPVYWVDSLGGSY